MKYLITLRISLTEISSLCFIIHPVLERCALLLYRWFCMLTNGKKKKVNFLDFGFSQGVDLKTLNIYWDRWCLWLSIKIYTYFRFNYAFNDNYINVFKLLTIVTFTVIDSPELKWILCCSIKQMIQLINIRPSILVSNSIYFF